MSEMPGSGFEPELEPSSHVDLSEKFCEYISKTIEWVDWHDFLQSAVVKQAVSITLTADLRNVNDGKKFAGLARMLKALNENHHLAAKSRQISIICTLEQKRLESNVFASGVKWIDAEES